MRDRLAIGPKKIIFRIIIKMQFEIVGGISRGSVCSLYMGRVTSPDGCDIVAVKYHKRIESSAAASLVDLVQNEAIVLVQLSGCKYTPRLHMFRSSDSEILLCTELFTGGDLMAHLEYRRTLDMDVCRCIVWDVVTALDDIHSRSFVHRDLKPESIVFDQSGGLRIVDFGIAHKIGEHRGSEFGSVDYMAPEVISSATPTGYAADYWSLGIILYEMLYGGPPFSDESRDRNKTIYRILHSDKYLNFPEMSEPADSKLAEDLISQLLSHNPARRLTSLTGIRSHPFFKQYSMCEAVNTIRKMALNFKFMDRVDYR